ncbi:histidine--tRNA ligase [Marinicella sp. W31]|uniref:histidine--tRNA ligase n=1 Tax=Marinicella sp. W31 TaxID=3023713 RepID=UPI00375837AB
MSKLIKSVRGMYDITPDEVWIWQRLEKLVTDTLNAYGYQQVRFPIVEQTALFHAAIGEATDVVEKEMYTFENRKGESFSLRPEGTASVVRLVLENALIRNQIQKLWYNGPMFRYEKPQQGRKRQFDQIGAEVFGLSGPDVDAELLLLTHRLWQLLGIEDVRLELNSLGTSECRQRYRSVLIEYLNTYQDQLDDEAKKRLHSNPLRILDSKNPDLKEIIANAPVMTDHLSAEAQDHFAELCQILDHCGLPYQINRRLVRGLDYYTHNVFEWITDSLGAQGTICAGGRYDKLVEMQGGKSTPATGFAMGVDRLVVMIKNKNHWQVPARGDVYVVIDPCWSVAEATALVEKLRDALPNLSVLLNLGGGSFKSQFKKADKSGAKFAIILGQDEKDQGLVSMRSLTDREAAQQQLTVADAVELLQQHNI